MAKSICVVCSKSIHKFEELDVLGYKWHKPCFKCGGTAKDGCGQALTLDSYREHEKQPYCSTCHIRLFSDGPVFQISASEDTWVDPNPSTNMSKLTSTTCTVCNEIVYKVEQIMANGRLWHKSCFKCGGTSSQGGCGRILAVTDYTEKDTNPYCKACYQQLFTEFNRNQTINLTCEDTYKSKRIENEFDQKKLNLLSLDEAPTCYVCEKVVYKYDEHKALNKLYHVNCFKCGIVSKDSTLPSGCKQLLSLKVYGEHESYPYCYKCCQQLFHSYMYETSTGLREQTEYPEWPPKKESTEYEDLEEDEKFWVDLENKTTHKQGGQLPEREKIVVEGSILSRAKQLYEGSGINVYERKIN